MARKLTEIQVLKKLDIPDFRHLTKDKIIEFASIYDKVDPEVAISAIEQFPSFAQAMKDCVAELKTSVDKGIESSESTTIEVLRACQQMLDTLGEMISDDELSFEEKERVMNLMANVTTTMREVNKDHHQFVLSALGILVSAVLGVGWLSVQALGGHTAVSAPDENSTSHDVL